MSTKILIMEDETDIQNFLKDVLEDAGYLVKVANDGMEGFTLFQQEQFDLILLDVMMPKIDGYVVLEMIRKESDAPVIMLAALGQEKDQIKGFDLEADDYVVKPFSMNIVLKRIEAALRRTRKINTEGQANLLTHKELTIDPAACIVRMSDVQISLTNTEFHLLKTLLENKSRVLTREQLLNDVWNYDYFGSDRVLLLQL